MKKIFKKPVWLLTLCMAVVVVFSLLANLVNTSAYQVKVENVEFKTENGFKKTALAGISIGEDLKVSSTSNIRKMPVMKELAKKISVQRG